MDGWDRVRRALLFGLDFLDRVKQATPWWPKLQDRLAQHWFRTLAGVSMAVVVLVAGYWAWGAWHARQLEELASLAKAWPDGKVLNTVTVEIKTKCVDSVLSYVVSLVPQKISAPSTLIEKTSAARALTDKLRDRLKVIHLEFVDQDGFPTATHDLAIDDFVRIYSTDEQRPVTLEARGIWSCRVTRYLRAEAIVLSWTERPE